MKKILVIIVLSLYLITPSQADDITDFEIDGISIGDSLNNFFNEKEISKAIDESLKDRKYLTKTFYNINSKIYDALQISYEANDKKRVIVSVVGVKSYPNNINECKKQMSIIESELTNMFPSAFKKNWGKYNSTDNKGHYFPITFDLNDGSIAMVSCHDWNSESGIEDNLKVSLFD